MVLWWTPAAGLELDLRSFVAIWAVGTVCLAFTAANVVRPVGLLTQALQAREDSRQRRDVMNRLTARNDEPGDAARALARIDAERSVDHQNIEERQQQVRLSATQLSAVLQAMEEGVLAVAADERVLFANKAAGRLLNLDPVAIEGRMVFECLRISHVHEAVKEAITAAESVSVEFRLPRSEIMVAMVASPLATGGVVLVLVNVTEVRRMESMRRDFVSGVSHELKTPLTVIQACTETLLDGAIDEPETAKRFLGQIEQQSERLLQLILGMLQLARVESGQQLLDDEPVDVFNIADDVVAEMRPVAEGKRIALDLAGEKELFVLGDYQAIRTIVGNLVDNALKYTNEGGEVRVVLQTDTSGNSLCVTDTGVGISQTDQERVFERFYRVERDRNRERGGTGLGLAIVKHLSQSMGAEVNLTSTPGKGSSISIRFPFREDRQL